MALRLLPTFEASLRRLLGVQSIAVSRWLGSGRGSANLIELATEPEPIVLYVKESTSDPGFWGLTKNQIKRLCSGGHRWFGVFLHHSATAGYVLSAGEIELQIREQRIRLAGDGDYKVNEHQQFSRSNYFAHLEELVPKLR
jgi:hypothetical protein